MVGVYVLEDNPGVTIGHTSVVSARTLDSGAMWRPVTSIAHEVFHRLGFAHASKSCGAGDGEDWPVPDGRMDSVGIDTTPGSGGRGRALPDHRRHGLQPDVRPHELLRDHRRATPRTGSPRATGTARLGSRRRSPPRLPWVKDARVVRARCSAASLKILERHAAEGPAAPDPGPSPYVLVAREVAGRVLASVPFKRFVGLGAAGADPVDLA